jgi:hypothetical protein
MDLINIKFVEMNSSTNYICNFCADAVATGLQAGRSGF